MVTEPLTGAAAAQRLSDRLGFGPSRAEVAGQRAPAQIVAQLLAQQPADLTTPDLGPQPQTRENGRVIPGSAERLRAQQDVLNRWWLDRMITTPTPFVEKMTWFWHGHFPTGAGAVENPNLMRVQNATERFYGTGSAVAMMQAMVVDPALLVWLNGNQSRREAPNENLGRELMELFTLGVGNYTEADVREAARALTGWQVDGEAFTVHPVPDWFDYGPKTVLGAPVTDAASLVSVLTGRPECARFLVARVWRRFVSTSPVPPESMERLVAALGPSRDMRALMAATVRESAMLDPASVLVKQPVEWAVGLLRALGTTVAGLGPGGYEGLQAGLREMGQFPFEPRDVGGWPAGDGWLTTGAARARYATAWLLAGRVDLSGLAGTAQANRPDAVAALLGLTGWSDRTRAALTRVADVPQGLLAAAACAPEYVVSR